MVRALSSRSRGNRAAVGVVLAFAIVAGGLAYALVVKPAVAVVRARVWENEACTVVSSAVKRLSRNAYDLDLVYEWHRGGRAFRGNRFDFFGRAYQDPQDWAPVLERLPPGRIATCYVNAARPEEAIVERAWKGGVWLPASVLSVFLMTVLALGFVAAPRPEVPPADRRVGASGPSGAAGPVALRPRSTPRRRLRRASLLAAFSTGTAVLAFVALLLPAWRAGQLALPLTLFVAVFALNGLLQIGRAASALAGLAGPTIVITAVPEAFLGERLVVEWKVDQRPELVTGVELALVGNEVVRYPDWDANHQQVQREEKAEFFRAALWIERASTSWAAGSAGIDVPRLLPPSFAARSNEIAWAIVLRASVRRLPDLAQEYPIGLRPPR